MERRERGRERERYRDGKKREIERKLRGDIKVKNKTRHYRMTDFR